jgi:hypothetical protein
MLGQIYPRARGDVVTGIHTIGGVPYRERDAGSDVSVKSFKDLPRREGAGQKEK